MIPLLSAICDEMMRVFKLTQITTVEVYTDALQSN